MKKFVLLYLLMILLLFPANARKAVERTIGFLQPDGSEIPIKLHGDAFFNYKTIGDGSIVSEDEDGWLCYAYFDSEGHLINSGKRIHDNVPPEVIAKSKLKPEGIMNLRRADKFKSLQGYNSVQRPSLKSFSSISGTERNGLVILAEYKDISFSHTKDDFVQMLTRHGYSRFGAQGCAVEYFDDQFKGKINFHFDVSEIVTLSKNRSYYGEKDDRYNTKDSRPEEMIAEACRLADKEIDFSRYDEDGDGIVDNVFVFFAGDDEAETGKTECIWSHAYYIYSGDARIHLELDGTRIDRYACTSETTYRNRGSEIFPDYKREFAGIGTFCHEYTHTFGLPDFYDTDYEGSGGTADALWNTTSLMDSGNHNNEGNTPPNYNAIEREMLGLSEPVELKESGTYTLEPINIQGQCYRINTIFHDEYFLLECRYPEGWDKYCGGKGLLIYHIDKTDRPSGLSESYGKMLSARERWDIYNEVNCRPDHQCAAIIAADPYSKKAGDIFYPQNGKNVVYGSKLKFWEGGESGVTLSDIRFEGKNIVFHADVKENKLYPTNIDNRTFTNSAIIMFESQTKVKKAKVELSKYGETEKITGEAVPYLDNKFSIKVNGLQAATRYAVKIYLYNEDEGEEIESGINFTIDTKRYSELSHIAVTESYYRNLDGSFNNGARIPLEVICREEPEAVIWTFEGEKIQEGKDNFWTPERSGLLQAEIYFKDGSKERIEKELRLR